MKLETVMDPIYRLFMRNIAALYMPHIHSRTEEKRKVNNIIHRYTDETKKCHTEANGRIRMRSLGEHQVYNVRAFLQDNEYHLTSCDWLLQQLKQPFISIRLGDELYSAEIGDGQ
jgi:hypothetical protein